ncbi:hypothetical protein CYCD_06210 [Tenuifilaceae bacterium CYCD]|nr:hypothetical protein CYCD_06210 [Tenuifilaceae bacterium CYCD]
MVDTKNGKSILKVIEPAFLITTVKTTIAVNTYENVCANTKKSILNWIDKIFDQSNKLQINIITLLSKTDRQLSNLKSCNPLRFDLK